MRVVRYRPKNFESNNNYIDTKKTIQLQMLLVRYIKMLFFNFYSYIVHVFFLHQLLVKFIQDALCIIRQTPIDTRLSGAKLYSIVYRV